MSNVENSSKKAYQPVSLYGIFDTLVGDFIHRFPALSDSEAQSICRGIMLDPNSFLYKNRDSYQLCKLASFQGLDFLIISNISDLCPDYNYSLTDDPHYKEFLSHINQVVSSALESQRSIQESIRQSLQVSQSLQESNKQLLERLDNGKKRLF